MIRGVDIGRLLIGLATAAAGGRRALGRPAVREPSAHRTGSRSPSPSGVRAGDVEAAVLVALGVRQTVQAVVVARTGWRTLSAAVDLLHGASMLVLAAAAPRRYGRAGLLQVATSAVLISLESRADR